MWEVGLPSLLPATVQVATEGTAAGDYDEEGGGGRGLLIGQKG